MRKDYETVSGENAGQDERDFVEAFWTRRWQTVERMPQAESVTRRDEYRLMWPYLRTLPRGSRILDGGCGMGEWVVYLAGQGFDVVGLDLSERTIDRLKAALPTHQFACGDIRRTGFPDRSFDAYFSWGTFEHFENGLGECIQEACRILKPGGWLFVSVPFHNWRLILRDAWRLSGSVEPSREDGATTHRFYQWRLTQPELRRELTLRGFRVLTIKATAKDQGVHRWLQWDVPFLKEGTAAFALARRAFTMTMPSGFISHMIWAAARKQGA